MTTEDEYRCEQCGRLADETGLCAPCRRESDGTLE
jgi:hypothetical protein